MNVRCHRLSEKSANSRNSLTRRFAQLLEPHQKNAARISVAEFNHPLIRPAPEPQRAARTVLIVLPEHQGAPQAQLIAISAECHVRPMTHDVDVTQLRLELEQPFYEHVRVWFFPAPPCRSGRSLL